MATLQDLCLKTIEETGNDTREVLENVQETLPKRIWGRHPALTVSAEKRIVMDGDTIFEILIFVTIEYTGVYTLLVRREIDIDETDKYLKEHALEFLKREHPNLLPGETTEVWAEISGELTPEDEADAIERGRMWSHPVVQEDMKNTLLAYRITRLLKDYSRYRISLDDPQDDEYTITILSERGTPGSDKVRLILYDCLKFMPKLVIQ